MANANHDKHDALSDHYRGVRRAVRHGKSEIILMDDLPIVATGCLLPNGARITATCLTIEDDLFDNDRLWTRPLETGSRVRRRGYLRVVPGSTVEFVDAPEADLPSSSASVPARPNNGLGDDLLRSDRLRVMARGSHLFSQLLYAAPCDVRWARREDITSSCMSNREAARIVGLLQGEGGSLNQFFPVDEGTVDEAVLAELRDLGWDLLIDDRRAR